MEGMKTLGVLFLMIGVRFLMNRVRFLMIGVRFLIIKVRFIMNSLWLVIIRMRGRMKSKLKSKLKNVVSQGRKEESEMQERITRLIFRIGR